MKPYWRNCGYRHGNFGDELVPLILREALGVPFETRAEEMLDSDLVSLGSILSEIPHHYSGFVWGTGTMFHGSVIDLPDARIVALRGRLSANRLKFPCSPAIGDPGLLADGISIPQQCATYELSIIPHYVDMDNEELGKFLRRNPWVHVIDPCQPVQNVLSQVKASNAVLSSSLHGLVVSDALGVRNGWIKLSDRLSGGVFKFRDYYSAFGNEDPLPIIFAEGCPPADLIGQTITWPEKVAEIRQNLVAAFPGALR